MRWVICAGSDAGAGATRVSRVISSILRGLGADLSSGAVFMAAALTPATAAAICHIRSRCESGHRLHLAATPQSKHDQQISQLARARLPFPNQHEYRRLRRLQSRSGKTSFWALEVDYSHSPLSAHAASARLTRQFHRQRQSPGWTPLFLHFAPQATLPTSVMSDGSPPSVPASAGRRAFFLPYRFWRPCRWAGQCCEHRSHRFLYSNRFSLNLGNCLTADAIGTDLCYSTAAFPRRLYTLKFDKWHYRRTAFTMGLGVDAAVTVAWFRAWRISNLFTSCSIAASSLQCPRARMLGAGYKF